MARIAARVERPIKICRMEGRIRDQVDTISAFNLPDAIKRWYEETALKYGLYDPHFQANTVSVRRTGAGEEMYVATD